MGPGAWRWPPQEVRHTPACSRLRGVTRDRPPGRSATGLLLNPKEKWHVGVTADLVMQSCWGKLRATSKSPLVRVDTDAKGGKVMDFG